MYNAYQGGPPPGLAHHQPPPRPSPAKPASRSAAIPIIRPDGSVTPQTKSTVTSPTLAAAAPLGSKSTVSPSNQTSVGSAMAAGLSRTAAGAAVFVPKSSSGGSVAKQAATSAADNASQPDLSRLTIASSTSGNQLESAGPATPYVNPYARAATGSGGPGSAVFTPGANASGRGTPTGYGSTGGYDNEGPNSAFDPTYMGPIPPSHSHSSHNISMGASSDRQYNPYEAHDSHSISYDDPNAIQRQHIRAPLQYHLSAPPLPHTSNLHPHHMAQHAYFMDSNLREELSRRNEAINITSVPSAQELGGQIRQPQPDEVHVYKDLVALEPDSSGPLPYASRGNPVTIGGVPTQLLPRHLLPLNSSGGLQGMGSLANLPISSSGGPLAASMSLCRYPTEVHKATCTLDGKAYVLRRIAGFNLAREKEKALEGVERWRRLRCAGVVNVREAFTSWKWGEPSIVFVYDYHPHSNTLFAEHLLNRPMRQDPRTGRMQAAETHVTEKKMWSYIVQIAGALKKVHGEGLSVRSLEASKILLTGKNRVRINCCSILDVLLYDPANPSTLERTLQYQQEDLHQLGLLVLVLANRNSAAAHAQNVDASLDALSKHYSKEMRDVVAWLLRDPLEFGGGAASGNGPQSPSRPHHRQSSYPSTSSSTNTNDPFNRSKDASTLLSMIAPHVATEMESSFHYNDLLESSLSLELENARLMKILVKMGFINERPEFDWDSSWSSTGERYLVGLFRDWLFHSNEEAGSGTSAPNSGGGGGGGGSAGRAGPFQPGGGAGGGGQGHQQQRGPKPLVDLSFILTNLNRLDAGSEEKIMLTSRDEQSCLVVSYKEIKQAIESSFNDLSRGSHH